jgi:2-amino-4-hydroxy-6-hydroxymethyldihydropteridine diphosphokinase
MTAREHAGELADACIGLGSNLGDRIGALDRAFDEIAALPTTSLIARSSYYESAPLDAPGGDYVNAAARVRTALAPLALLRELQAIEARHGRTRPFANAPRTLDLDLLLYDGVVMRTAELELPHPRLHERAFVLVPLAEIAAELEVPSYATVGEMASRVAGQRLAKLKR